MRWLSAATAALLAAALVAPVTTSGALAAPGDVVIDGRGFGHGRGMGQYGALGYAVDQGWDATRILDHFYRGTTTGGVPDVPLDVELLAWRDRALLVTGGGLAVNGVPTDSGAVQMVRDGAGQFVVLTGPGCAGPWTPSRVAGAGAIVTAGTGVQLCEAGLTRGYRGDVRILTRPGGGTAVLNRVGVEDYLRGVVPRESPSSWAGLGGGRGARALEAQSVAARSYALSSRFAAYADTCDTTTCQVYGGAFTRSQTTGAVTWVEDARTDLAVFATRGTVRLMPGGGVARTEFSSSTGGWSAGGAFPAVEDVGDATTANPNRAWRVELSRAAISQRIGVGPLRGFQVTRRNGLGPAGGRVLEVTATTASGPVVLSGASVRTALGLRSDWFSVSPWIDPRTFEPVVRALWLDLLGRAPSSAELTQRSEQLAQGGSAQGLALEVGRSQERAQRVVAAVYGSALGRSPSVGEIQGWTALYQQYGSVPQLQSGVLASEEAWLLSGRSEGAWVDRMYRTTLGRGASAGEQRFWGDQIAGAGRYRVALAIAGSQEAGLIRLDAYYRLMLGRGLDPSSGAFVSFMLGERDGDVLVPASLGGSAEYAARSAGR